MTDLARRGAAAALVALAAGPVVPEVLRLPGVVVAGALVPGALWAVALTRLLPATRRGWVDVALAFAWGAACATWIAQRANDALLAWLPPSAVHVVGGPLVEEVAKAAGLLVVAAIRPGALDGPLRGAVLGLVAGAGFATVENLGYLLLAGVQGGEPAVLRAVWVRPVVAGLLHPSFTALTGAALGTGRPRLWLAGLAAAVAAHALWNGVGSEVVTTLLCDAGPSGACAAEPPRLALLVTAPLVTAACALPGVAVVAALRRRPSGRGARA